MKKYLVNILFLLTLCISSTTFVFPNEPNGFRDLYWGETLQEAKNSGYDVSYVSYDSLNRQPLLTAIESMMFPMFHMIPNIIL